MPQQIAPDARQPRNDMSNNLLDKLPLTDTIIDVAVVAFTNRPTTALSFKK